LHCFRKFPIDNYFNHPKDCAMQGTSPLNTRATTLSVTEIMDRIEKQLKAKNVTIFAHISHSKAAQEVGLIMQDEELIIFGNPKTGTPLMIESPAIGIELPLKIIAWAENQKTLVGWQNVARLSQDYHITQSSNTIELLKGFLQDIVDTAIK
jgi:uncharacterized protein (DUF302 family)